MVLSRSECSTQENHRQLLRQELEKLDRPYSVALIPLRPAFGVYLLLPLEEAGIHFFEGEAPSNFPFR